MPGGDIYQAWANATPTTPFPFQYSDKKVGKIQQSWADVRAGIQKDAISTTLPFCTSHITPTILQVNIIADAIRKETQFQKKWDHESAARCRSAASDNASPVSFNGSEASSSSALRRALRSAQEQDALVNSEGGRGRKAYLKMRQLMEPKERFQGRPRTASHQYGWNIETTKDTEAQFRSLSSALSATHGSSSLNNTQGATPAVDDPRRAGSNATTTSQGRRSNNNSSAAEANLSEALLRERQQGSRGDVATSLTIGRTSSPKHKNGDYRRNNTLQNDRRASGVKVPLRQWMTPAALEVMQQQRRRAVDPTTTHPQPRQICQKRYSESANKGHVGMSPRA
ncbi:Hypothetical protein, putative [Bodo saltans]|uniref:Sperm microtubule inner protein 1 C-terminal domain-containing protein n=1 Tax=Bodo saltans TaxID=75058 RepID=A0A0S4J869_BODSA|nr:Hypothetical protein, putative [Bodo saltans]|eukprot:CUG87703.1 Hypothetical protein, putative [Bodo saltans]